MLNSPSCEVSSESNLTVTLPVSRPMFFPPYDKQQTSLVDQMVKNPAAMWETWDQSLGWEGPLEEDTATYSSILVWRIP